MMVVTPTRMNTDDDNQSAILALVMDRVKIKYIFANVLRRIR